MIDGYVSLGLTCGLVGRCYEDRVQRMTTLSSDDHQELRPYDAPQHCSYCGQVLNPRLYFCHACGTPYKDERTVLPSFPAPRLTDGELVRQKAPRAMKLFWTYFGIVMGTAIVSALTFEENRPDLAYLFATSAVFGTTFILAALHWGTLWPQLRRSGFGSREAWVALALLIPLFVLNVGYHGVLSKIIPEHVVAPWVEMRKHGFDTATIVTSLAIFPALAEEVAFRGLLQHWLHAALKPWKAILLASALFTALHFNVLSAPYLFLLGLLLGWVKWKTGSLYPSMAIHFLHNAAAVLLFQ